MDKIIDKIRKLLTLAKDKGATEAEALAAMTKAHELLALHNLDIGEVATIKTAIEDGILREGGNKWGHKDWMKYVAAGAADLNFCTYYFDKSGGTLEHHIIGRRDNVLAAQILTQYLIENVNALSLAYGLQFPTPQRETNRRGFRIGAGMRLRQRCKQLRKDREERPTTTSSGTNLPALASLYVRSAEENERFLAERGVRLEVRPGAKRRGGSALQAGALAANNIGLDRQLT